MDNLRAGRGIQIIKTHDSAIRMIRALKKNRIIAVLSDQDAHEDGVFVPFFGRLASTPRGGAVLQLKTDASPIFCFSTGLPGGKWQITLEDIPVPGEGIDMKDAEIQLLTYVTERLEEEIRKRPGPCRRKRRRHPAWTNRHSPGCRPWGPGWGRPRGLPPRWRTPARRWPSSGPAGNYERSP